MSTRTRKKRVWLLHWFWIQPNRFASYNESPIAGVFDPRITAEKVRWAMQVIYDAAKNQTASTRAHQLYDHSVRRQRQPYGWDDAECVHTEAGAFVVGSGDPFLYGQKVEDYCLDQINHLNEIFYWTSPPSYRYRDDEGFSLVQPLETTPATNNKVEISYYDGRTLTRWTTGKDATIPKKIPILADEEFLLTLEQSKFYPR